MTATSIGAFAKWLLLADFGGQGVQKKRGVAA
jgi:hypothetical protein